MVILSTSEPTNAEGSVILTLCQVHNDVLVILAIVKRTIMK